jgi:hypothetical protein
VVKSAIVIGGARCVFDDIDAACALARFDLWIVCNDIGGVLRDDIDYWVTLHPEKLRGWQDKRAAAGFNQDYKSIIHVRSDEECTGRPRIDEVIPYEWDGVSGSGSSGLFAVRVAKLKGAKRIVLAGVPMTAKAGHFFDDKDWGEFDSFLGTWAQLEARLKKCCRSMSGWTAALLGKPDAKWIDEA